MSTNSVSNVRKKKEINYVDTYESKYRKQKKLEKELVSQHYYVQENLV